ncbi:response regulator transcription factor [Pseudolysinimonas kribbensis]|uniref:Sensory transduction protein n=1 Tax=Pseudolysinimonas kribbensis TaxID=433641 RepID=A0ABQ6JY04_9MICO|nr:response regulator transcription factor [Pseudolysinimonas kribbensis]GMA93195.1 putative sensory transduction protein [Pseudolysinimonas kribbensis]
MAERDARRVAVVIEDDDDIRNLLETVLTQGGFEVVARSNGLDGIEAVRAFSPTVTTLDVNMPGIDGFETAKRIRAFSSTYIVMLTALDEEIDTLQGLEAGADDYITKPFRPRELRARIEAMLRRPRTLGSPDDPASVAGSSALSPADDASTEPVQPGAETDGTPVASGSAVRDDAEGWIEHNGLRLNLPMHIVRVDDEEIPLTRSEFELLAALMQSGRRVRTKADLALLLRGESYVTSHFVSEADKRGIEVHMGNLRKKIGESSATPRWIETVRGVGYRLTAADD